MAGIINGATDYKLPELPKPTTANVAKWTPTTSEVNAPTDTVGGQITTLLDQSNPYITRARDRANIVSNERGLINSSIAAGAGEAAAIDAALPIATHDANTYNQNRLTNLGYVNQAGSQNAQLETQTNQFNATQQNTGDLEVYRQGAGLVGRQMEIDSAAKLQEGQQAFTAKENAAQREFTAGQNTAQREFEAAQAAAKRDWDEMMANTAFNNQLTLQEKQQAWTEAQNLAQRAFDAAQRQLDRDLQLALDKARSSQTGQAAVSNALINYQSQAATILADPNMTPEVKQQQLAKLSEVMKSSLSAIAKIYGVDVSDILSPTAPNDAKTGNAPGQPPPPNVPPPKTNPSPATNYGSGVSGGGSGYSTNDYYSPNYKPEN